MSIENITNYYQSEKLPNIVNDYKQLQTKLGINSKVKDNESDTPWWNEKIVQKIMPNDYAYGNMLSAMAVLNGPTDIDSLFSAYKQIKSKFKDKMPDGYDPKVAQHPFSFFRGTVLNDYLNPNSDKCINKNFAEKIIEKDVSLRDTPFGKWIMDKLGVKENFDEQIQTKIRDITYTETNPEHVIAKVYTAKNSFGDLTTRALSRIPRIGVYALSGIAAAHAASQISNGSNPIKETGRAILGVGTTLVGMGYLGAIGYKHFGACGSLIGMTTGTFIGSKVQDWCLSLYLNPSKTCSVN